MKLVDRARFLNGIDIRSSTYECERPIDQAGAPEKSSADTVEGVPVEVHHHLERPGVPALVIALQSLQPLGAGSGEQAIVESHEGHILLDEFLKMEAAPQLNGVTRA